MGRSRRKGPARKAPLVEPEWQRRAPRDTHTSAQTDSHTDLGTERTDGLTDLGARKPEGTQGITDDPGFHLSNGVDGGVLYPP